MNEFIAAYIECALWCGIDSENGQETPEGDEGDLSEEALKEMTKDCKDFYEAESDKWQTEEDPLSDEQAGHDFYLSRNGHGAGFFDSGHENADELQKAAKVYGTQGLYFGDDGKLYTHG